MSKDQVTYVVGNIFALIFSLFVIVLFLVLAWKLLDWIISL